jgi:hypothetical protein
MLLTSSVFVLLQVFGSKFAFSLQSQLLHDGLLGDGISPMRFGRCFPVLEVGSGRLCNVQKRKIHACHVDGSVSLNNKTCVSFTIFTLHRL